MSVIIITGLLILGGAFIVFIIYLQLKEQARIEKLRKATSLNNQTRQVRHYLDDLPAQYQPKDMRLWLYTRLIEIFDELLAIAPDEKTERRRAKVMEEFEIYKGTKQKRKAKPINDELMVINLRRLLDSLQAFLKHSRGRKKIDADTFDKYSQAITFYRFKLGSDNKAFLARQLFLSGKLEESIQMYQRAINDLAPIASTPDAQELEKRLTVMKDEIEKDLKLQEEEAKMLAENQEEDESLTEEWNKFIDNDGFTKKRTF